MAKRITSPLSLSLLVAVSLQLSCGGEGEKSGNANLQQANLPLAFPDNVEVGDKFLLSPFVLGDPETVNGKTATRAGQLSISADRAALSFRHITTDFTLTKKQTRADYEAKLRTFLNRIQPREYPSFKHFEREAAKYFAKSDLALTEDPDHRELIRRVYSAAKARTKSNNLLLQESSCPQSFSLPGRTNPIEVFENQDPIIAKKEEHSSFCLIYLANTGESETDPAKVVASIEQSLATIKKVIGNDLDQAVAGYEFKPLVVVLPFDDPTLVPAEFEKFSGAFSSDVSSPDANARPTVLIASDQTIANEDDIDRETDYFHATLGHELFHAASYFYRVYTQGGGTGEPEAVSIDEGFAHLVEDILGYGPLNFNSVAGAFLTEHPSTSIAEQFSVFDTTTNDVSLRNRGAAQSFIYYLTSQSGGLTFDGSGKLEGGSGLSFLNAYFASTGGAAGIGTAYSGGSLGEAFEGFIGSLAVNNSDREKAVHSVQDVTAVTNLTGAASNYGIKFNNFSDIPSVADKVGQNASYTAYNEAELIDHDFHYYQLAPILVTVEADVSGLLLVLNGDTRNFGASFIKVQ